MTIYQELVDFDDLIKKSSVEPIIINDLVDDSIDRKEYIKSIITTRYGGDMVSLIPTCHCGTVTGAFSINTVCDICHRPVRSTVEQEIEPSVWFRKPTGTEALINPAVFLMLRKRFSKVNFDLIRYITDSSYKPPEKRSVEIDRVINSGLTRSYNNFIRNFDEIMEFLFSLKTFQIKTQEKKYNDVDYLQLLIKEQRNKLFSNYIPLPNRSLLIIEKTNLGIYVDNTIISAIDAIQMLVGIDITYRDQKVRAKENRTSKALCKLSDFYFDYFKNTLSPKEGHFRKHVYGTRTNFSFRAVITSIIEDHRYDEIHIPWGVGLTVLRPHIVNKLLRRGFSLNAIIGLINGHIEKYNPLLDDVLKEIIAESKYGGLVAILQRN